MMRPILSYGPRHFMTLWFTGYVVRRSNWLQDFATWVRITLCM